MGRASRPRARACVRIARAPRREHKACAAGRLVGLSVGFPAGTAIVRLWNDEQAWDHDRLDRLERRAFDARAAGDFHAAGQDFALFARGLRRHIGFEEALLFPEVERRTGIPAASGPSAVMRAEHREIVSLLEAIEPAIGDGALPADSLRQRLHAVLGAHNGKEEQVLYPLADRLLAPAERDLLVRRIQLFQEG